MKQHEGLKNLYEEVVSGKFGWDRWGLLSVLADCTLNYVNGNILEIGAGESSIYLSKLAEKYNRTCYHIEYSKSGVENMKNTKGYFGKNSKVFNMKSDEFFKQTNQMQLAFVFIDGDHLYEQVRKDFYNSLNYLLKDGIIVLHDTLPPDKTWTLESRCGTVFKLRREIEADNRFDIFTFPFTAFDVGLSIVKIRENRK